MADNAKKFLFDNNDFGEEAQRRKREEAKRPTFSQAEMEASRQTGFEQGRIAGINETLQSQEAHIRDLMQQVVMASTRLEQEETKRLTTFIEQATLVSAQALSKTIPALLDHMSAEQMMNFIRDVFAAQIRAQSVTIHVPVEHHGQISERLEKHMAGMKRKVSCTIHADPTLTKLQCRFEWTGGGAEWNPGTAASALMDAIISHLPQALQPQVQFAHAPHAEQPIDENVQTPHNQTSPSGEMP